MERKPNILFILTDQQSSWTISAYGAKGIFTPNIDRIAKEGALLSNYFTNSAVCTPSRGCIFTGMYPHSHGAFMNDMEINRDCVTIADILKNNGYDTGYIGKWHLDGTASGLHHTFSIIGEDPEKSGIRMPQHNRENNCIPPDRSMGFDDCRYMFEVSHGKKVIEYDDGTYSISSNEIGDEDTYTTDWLANKADEFIRTDREKPFFLVLSIPDPHQPFTVRAPYDKMFKAEDMEVPSTFYNPNKPAWLEKPSTRVWTLLSEGMTEENLKKAKAQYFGQVKCIDDNIGKLLKSLESIGKLDDTIVIFSTDHGEYMGEHGIMYKNQLYETAYRIPFLIRWPEKIKAGTVVNRFISTVDFQQTILGLIEIEPSGNEQGRDASPFLLNSDIPWEDEVFIYSTRKHRAGIFTPEYQLAYVKENCDNLLFDRKNDPEQKENLFYKEEYREVRSKLKKRLVEHNVNIGAPEAAWLQKECY